MLTIITLRLMMTSFLFLFSGRMILPGLIITLPANGAEVQGVVEIQGSIPEEGFASAELFYAYAEATEKNWFLITEINQPLQNGVLATWDTTTISDGVYSLKLVVLNKNGNRNEVEVGIIHVANYSRIENITVQTPAQYVTETEIVDKSIEGYEQPTALPENPASMDMNQLQKSAVIGVIFAVIVLSFLATRALVRKFQSRR